MEDDASGDGIVGQNRGANQRRLPGGGDVKAVKSGSQGGQGHSGRRNHKARPLRRGAVLGSGAPGWTHGVSLPVGGRSSDGARTASQGLSRALRGVKGRA